MEDILTMINVEMAERETKGDKTYFDALLAPTFAFRRASGAFDDRQIFLAGLRRGAERKCKEGSIKVMPFGSTRAFVTCVVTVQGKKGPESYHNARLFVLDATDSWRLLAWANEPEV